MTHTPTSHGPWRVEDGQLVRDLPAATIPASLPVNENPAPAEPETTEAPRKRRSNTED